MTCEEFERALQAQADGRATLWNADLLSRHAQSCRACRELEDGFRLFMQGFAISRVPAGVDFTPRVLAALEHERPYRLASQVRSIPLAAAAAVLLAFGAAMIFLARPADSPIARHSNSDVPVTVTQSSSELLFPELAEGESTDLRDEPPLVAAVEPVSEIVRAFGLSIERPVRPIAAVASQTLGNWIREFPNADPSMMPGMREVMPAPMMDKTRRTNRS